MKKILFPILLFMAGVARAEHTLIFLNADNLTQGTVPNARLDPTSVTLQGPNIGGQFSALHTATANIISSFNTSTTTLTNSISYLSDSYRFTIATGPGLGADFYGVDRTPFVQAIASAALSDGRASIYVQKGTYTVRDVVSNGIDWVFDRGAVIKQAELGQMFRVSNGSIRGGVVMTSATTKTASSSAAFVLGDYGKMYDMVFTSCVYFNYAVSLTDFYGMIESSGTIGAEIRNCVFKEYQNLNNNSAAKGTFIGLKGTTGAVVSDNYMRVVSTNPLSLTAAIKAANAEVRIENNHIDIDGVSGVFMIDEPGQRASKYAIRNNTFNQRAALIAIIDATSSSGSVIMGNRIIDYNGGATGIHVQGGGYGNHNFSPASLLVSQNTMSSVDGLVDSNTFLSVTADALKDVSGIVFFGNASSQVGTFSTTSGDVVSNIFRSNTKDGVIVTDVP